MEYFSQILLIFSSVARKYTCSIAAAENVTADPFCQNQFQGPKE